MEQATGTYKGQRMSELRIGSCEPTLVVYTVCESVK
jgi:hypothetical protein